MAATSFQSDQFKETGEQQPVNWPRCNHAVASKAAQEALLIDRKCPKEGCDQVVPLGTTINDMLISTQALNKLPGNTHFNPPFSNTSPTALNGENISGAEALGAHNHDGLRVEGAPLPYASQPLIGSNTYLARRQYLEPYKIAPERREQLRKVAQEDPSKLPKEDVKEISVGGLVAAPNTRALDQPLHAGCKRFMLEEVYTMADLEVDASIFETSIRQRSGGTVPQEQRLAINSQCKGVFGGDAITIRGLDGARGKHEYMKLVDGVGMRHDDVMHNALDQALKHAMQNEMDLYRGLNRVRADGRVCRLYVCDSIVKEGGRDMARLRRVMPGNMKEFDGVKRAHRMKVRRGGLAKGPMAQFKQEVDQLRGSALKNMAKLMYGVHRDDGWVEALLSGDGGGQEDDSDEEGQPGWRIYDPDDGLESDDDDL